MPREEEGRNSAGALGPKEPRQTCGRLPSLEETSSGETESRYISLALKKQGQVERLHAPLAQNKSCSLTSCDAQTMAKNQKRPKKVRKALSCAAKVGCGPSRSKAAKGCKIS